MRTVNLAPGALPLQQQVHVNDSITIQTTAHTTLQLTVTAIEPDAIVGLVDGSEQRIPVQQIAQLEVKQFDGAKTVGMVAMVAGVLALAVGKAIYKDGKRLAPK